MFGTPQYWTGGWPEGRGDGWNSIDQTSWVPICRSPPNRSFDRESREYYWKRWFHWWSSPESRRSQSILGWGRGRGRSLQLRTWTSRRSWCQLWLKISWRSIGLSRTAMWGFAYREYSRLRLRIWRRRWRWWRSSSTHPWRSGTRAPRCSESTQSSWRGRTWGWLPSAFCPNSFRLI